MSALDAVLGAISALQSHIQALASAAGGSGGGVAATAITGTLGMSGNHPTVTLSAGNALDPKDLVRVSAAITVREAYNTQTKVSPGGEDPDYWTTTNVTYDRVVQVDAVAGVSADGLKLILPPIVPTRVKTAARSNGAYATIGTQTYVSGTLQLVTRYHYVP